MRTESIYFKNSKNQRISGRIYCEGLASKGVIFCHGLFSSKDGYKINHLASDIVKAGYTLLTFDFSFAGDSEGDITDLSIVQEVDDLACAIEFFKGNGVQSPHIIGSSIGGTVALLYSSGRGNEISSLSLIATPVKLKELMHKMTDIRKLEKLPKHGVTNVDGIMIKNNFFRELLHFDMEKSIAGIRTPTMIIHGDMDAVVDPDNASLLYKRINADKRLIIIKGGDHSLTSDTHLSIIRENLLDWLP